MIPVDDLRCPLCGGTVKWACGAESPGGTGHADCENGIRVSRRVRPDGTEPHWTEEPCQWPGCQVARDVAGAVWAVVQAPLRLTILGVEVAGEPDALLRALLNAAGEAQREAWRRECDALQTLVAPKDVP